MPNYDVLSDGTNNDSYISAKRQLDSPALLMSLLFIYNTLKIEIIQYFELTAICMAPVALCINKAEHTVQLGMPFIGIHDKYR